jgi:hypothetical protein
MARLMRRGDSYETKEAKCNTVIIRSRVEHAAAEINAKLRHQHIFLEDLLGQGLGHRIHVMLNREYL